MSKNLPPSMGLYKKCCRGSYMHLYVFLEVTRHGFSGVYGVYWASLSYFLQNPVLAKRHTASLKASSADQKEKREAQKDIQTRKQRRRQNLVKPSVLQQGHERKLRRVATRGGKCWPWYSLIRLIHSLRVFVDGSGGLIQCNPETSEDGFLDRGGRRQTRLSQKQNGRAEIWLLGSTQIY
eukprot:gb/GECG01006977.1/.p1 GENE.gb/GECG01006977.1/~~gb/GECG01006977.1/.p1  ORF type:complete len:180 (+),score=14.98 gb/GECG01006977.1/:1-540(+)